MNLIRPRKHSRLSLRLTLANARGAIDLASIMIGVLVLGIIGGTIAATVFAVIPWSQDAAAKATLGQVRNAESVYYVAHNPKTYADYAALQMPLTLASGGGGSPTQPSATVFAASAPLLPASGSLAVTASASGWAAVSESATKKLFYATSLDSNVSTTVPVLPAGVTMPVPPGSVLDLAAAVNPGGILNNGGVAAEMKGALTAQQYYALLAQFPAGSTVDNGYSLLSTISSSDAVLTAADGTVLPQTGAASTSFTLVTPSGVANPVNFMFDFVEYWGWSVNTDAPWQGATMTITEGGVAYPVHLPSNIVFYPGTP